MRSALLAAAVLIPVWAQAAGGEDAYTTASIGGSVESVSNGSPAWREQTVSLRHQYAKRHGAGIEAGETERFGLRDSRFALDYTVPAGDRLTVTLDAGFSPTHRVLARHAVGAAAQYEFQPAWLLHAAARTTSYDAATVNQTVLGIERYVADFGWAAFWRPSRAFGTTAHSGELRGSYYYGDRNSVSLILAAGQEASNVGTSVVLAHVSSIAISGKHWLDRRWALAYAASHTRQGDLYNRNGVSLGVQYAF